MDEGRAALIAGIQWQIAAIARQRAAPQCPLTPLPPPPQRCAATGVLNALLYALLMLCVLFFLVICWRLLGDYRATPSDRDTAFVVIALFLAGTLFGWWVRGMRR
jgi:hypothetical protein